MKRIEKFLVGILCVGLVIIISGCAKNTTEITSDTTKGSVNQESKIKVAATIFPVYDILKNVGGQHIEVVLVLPPGASPHTFDPSPSDIKNLHGTDIVFSIGHELDIWVDDIIESLGNVENIHVDEKISLLKFGEEEHHDHGHDENHDENDHSTHEDEHGYDGHHEAEAHQEDHSSEDEHDDHDDHDEDEHHHAHGEFDPHYWLSLENAQQISLNIAEELAAHDVKNKQEYLANAKKYNAELEKHKKEFVQKVNSLDHKEIITFHDSWEYFADEFGLEVLAVFEVAPGKKPSPRHLEEIYELTQEHNLKALFSEPQLSTALIQAAVQDLDLSLYVLDPLGGVDGRNSYIELMEYNIEKLHEALK